MSNKELRKLINNRKKWVSSSKENIFDFDSILSGMYNDPSHFIYEILQNAEDEGAREVKFELYEDRLEIFHNGKDFDLEDIQGVTGIGISKKKDDLTAIGKFGVGFKSVFAITENLYIYSGDYNIKITDFVVPNIVGKKEVDNTLIILPFNHKKRLSKEVFDLISKKLENIGLKAMLFLKNIEKITWQTPLANGEYFKSSKILQEIPCIKKTTLKSRNTTEKYITIGRLTKIGDNKLRIEVAYKLGKNEKGEEMIVPDTDSKLVVYFPTEKVTYLNFLIQGPYITTSSRENIPLEDKQNKKLLGEHAKLIAESLSIIRDLGFLNINFLDLLPIHPDNKDKEIVYSVIFDKVKERLLNEKLLPTTDSIYAKASEVLLARGKDLPDLLDQKDLQRLFSKKYWLDINITYDKTRELRDYIINELKVEEVDFESFARKINVDFLQPKSDRWMIDLYSRLLDQKSLWIENRFNQPGILRNKPIIRLKNGEHIVPFNDNGDPQVYLPTGDKTNYKTVKKNLLENDLSLKFLEELGLKKPDLFAEVREFILPKYQKENPEKDGDYYRDFEKLIKVYENEEIPENKKREFLNELSNLSLIISSKNNGEEICLKKPTEIYFSNDDLINYFKEYADVYFVNSLLYKNFDKHKLEVFLRRLGVEDKPRRIEIKANLSDEKKRELRSRRYGGRYVGWTRDISEKDYKYEGLENCFEQFSFEKSMLLWTFLLKNIESLESYEAKRFFEGEYRWKYRYDYTEIFDAKFLKLLQQKKWLIDKNDICRKPSDITVLELPEEYIKKSTNIDLLKEKLGFKPDIYDQLPEEWKNKLEIIKEISAEDLKMLIVKQKKKDLPKAEGESTNWNPEYKPGEIDVPIKEFKPDRIITPDRGGQSYMLEINTSGGLKGTEETNNVKDIPEVINHDDVKKIGEYGEEIVYHALLSEYKEKGTVAETGFGFKVVNKINEELEIFWLNKLSNIGKGYDFVTKKNRKEIEYIEVKTKIHEDNELIQVTGPQWEFARKLYERREGEKYFIYLVTNAGKSNVSIKKIRNPIKLWKEGRLYAHPINLSL